MKIHQLQEAVRLANINEHFISYPGEMKDESYVLEKKNDHSWNVYYSERGQRTGERFFTSEEEACGGFKKLTQQIVCYFDLV
jgi:hypothetical protein